METIAQFNDNDGLNVKLTNDRIYISSTGNEETFALRGINGVGLYDDIEKFNTETVAFKENKGNNSILGIMLIIVGIILLIAILITGEIEILVFAIIIIILRIFLKNKSNKLPKPVLDSYFKFMLSGADRKFKFNKSDDSSTKIADFINKIEDTLTAYNN